MTKVELIIHQVSDLRDFYLEIQRRKRGRRATEGGVIHHKDTKTQRERSDAIPPGAPNERD